MYKIEERTGLIRSDKDFSMRKASCPMNKLFDENRALPCFDLNDY